MKRNKLMATCMAGIMALSSLAGATPSFGLAAPQATSVTVEVSAQAENTFLIPHKKIAVDSQTAENFGYTDSVPNGVSTLDVLVAAHKVVFESAFTTETKDTYLQVSGGFAQKIFGDDRGSMFAINGEFPHYDNLQQDGNYLGSTLADTEIHQNDTVEFMTVQDEDWMDMLTWFEKDGKRISQVAIEEKQSAQTMRLTLRGYEYGWYGYLVDKASIIKPVEDAKITIVDSNGNQTDIASTITNAAGEATLTIPSTAFPRAGIYCLSAYTRYEDETDTAIFSPWCRVEVLPTGTIAQVEEKITQIGTVDVTSGSNIQAARAAYDALSEAAKALCSNYDVLTQAEAAYKALVKPMIEEVERKITAIGTVSLTSGGKIQAARTGYDALPDGAKALCSNYHILTNAEATYKTLVTAAIADVKKKITAIGAVRLTDGTKIQTARTAYNNLPAEAKRHVTNYGVLTQAEASYQALLQKVKTAKAKKTTLKCTVKRGKAKLKWKKQSGVSGYVIYRSTKKKSGFKKIKTIQNPKTTTYADSKVKKKKTYYYKLRPYTIVDKQRIYGKHSNIVKKR